MAKTPYVMQKRFGELTPSKIGVVGSFADGNPQTSTDLADIQDSARFSEGLTRILVNGASPTVEDFNGILYLLTSQIRRMQRTGLGEWQSGLIYSEGDIVSYNGCVFISTIDDNYVHSPADALTSNDWRLIAAPKNSCRVTSEVTLTTTTSATFTLAPTELGFKGPGLFRISGAMNAAFNSYGTGNELRGYYWLREGATTLCVSYFNRRVDSLSFQDTIPFDMALNISTDTEFSGLSFGVNLLALPSSSSISIGGNTSQGQRCIEIERIK